MKLFENLIGNRAIMGMNQRNRNFVDRLNPKPLIATAKDKIATKQTLQQRGVRVPETFAVVQCPYELDPFYTRLVQRGEGFVVKPARSSQGRGVLICSKALPNQVLLSADRAISREEFFWYLRELLNGQYSFGRPVDSALVEQRIEADHCWIMRELPGPPDLRIITKMGRPIMAMARLPTRASLGRANLHCGGIGVGIDLDSGMTTTAVWKNRPIRIHPDTGQGLARRRVEELDQCLLLARKCYDALPLGYMGVDIMYEASQGPVVIELNARPGLAVQIANQRGLLQIP